MKTICIVICTHIYWLLFFNLAITYLKASLSDFKCCTTIWSCFVNLIFCQNSGLFDNWSCISLEVNLKGMFRNVVHWGVHSPDNNYNSFTIYLIIRILKDLSISIWAFVFVFMNWPDHIYGFRCRTFYEVDFYFY